MNGPIARSASQRRATATRILAASGRRGRSGRFRVPSVVSHPARLNADRVASARQSMARNRCQSCRRRTAPAYPSHGATPAAMPSGWPGQTARNMPYPTPPNRIQRPSHASRTSARGSASERIVCWLTALHLVHTHLAASTDLERSLLEWPLPDRGHGVDLDALVHQGPCRRHAPGLERQPVRVVDEQKPAGLELRPALDDASLAVVPVHLDEVEVAIRELVDERDVTWHRLRLGPGGVAGAGVRGGDTIGDACQ